MGGVDGDKLPTSKGVSCELTKKTLGMARRKEPNDETWDSGKTDDVHGKLGHKNSLRRGETEARGLDPG